MRGAPPHYPPQDNAESRTMADRKERSDPQEKEMSDGSSLEGVTSYLKNDDQRIAFIEREPKEIG